MRALATIAAMLSVSTASAESAAPRAQVTPAIVTLVLNEIQHGERIVYLRGSDVLVAAEDLAEIGLALPGSDREMFGDTAHVSLAGAAPEVAYAVEETTLRITSDPDLLPATRIELGSRHAPAAVSYRRDPSLFINYAAQSQNDRVHGYGEAGFSAGELLVHSSMTVTPAGDPIRGPSIMSWDDRDDLRRVAVGDQFASGGALGGGGFVGGVHLRRSFDLDPYLVLQPTLGHTGTVISPSTAEVYVNGALVSRHDLAPGRFHIDDLPATTGAGDARIVIRDSMGRTQELGGSYYLAPNLLAPGLSDYQLSIGAIRENLGDASFDYGDPVAMGRYRRGLSSHVSAGARAEASLGVASGGLEMAVGTPLGEIGLAGAASAEPNRRGVAGLTSWGYRGRRVGVGVNLRLTSDHYATVDVAGDDDRAVVDLRSHVSVATSRRSNVGLHGAWTRYRDTGAAARATLTSSVQPTSGWTVSASAGAARLQTGVVEMSAFVTLIVGLGRSSRGSLTHETGLAQRSRGELRRSVPGQTGIGYHFLAEVGDSERGYGAVDAHASFGRYRAGYQWSEAEQRIEASVAGGVVLIGGRLFATQPIERGFALVRVPDANGVRTYLENREVGRTDDRGDYLITRMQPYYGSRVAIAPLDLAGDRTVAQTSKLVAPPRLGGAIVEFPTRQLRVVRGTVRVGSGDAEIVPAYGEVTVGDVSSPVGVSGEFELDGVDRGRAGHATLIWDGGRCRFALRVPDSSQPIVDVGTVRCRRSER